MEPRNATVAVIGAVDYIGAAIAKNSPPKDSSPMRAAAVAETYWQFYNQPRDAWTFEMEIRRFREKW